MTEQELRFVLSAQDEGLKRGILEAEKAVEGLDQAVLKLAGTQLQYNTAAQWFVDNSGRYVAQEKALNQAGIITSKQLSDQIRLLDQLIVQEQRDAVVTRQLIAEKERLQKQYGLLDAAQTKTGAALKSNTQLYFQAGQAVSDFAVAGIRGAANNIEFLAASLGASAPLMIGISVVAAAFFVFGDDVAEALNPVAKKIKEIEGAVDDLFTVIGDDREKLALFERQLPEAIRQTKDELDALEKSIIRRGGSTVGIFSFLLRPEEQDALAALRANLKQFETEYQEVQNRIRAANALRRVDGVKANEDDVKALRLRLEELGLAEEAADLDNTALLRIIDRREEEKLINDLRRDRVKQSKDELTETEKLTKQNEELSTLLANIRSGERDRTEELRIQNKQLNEQIRQAQKILELRTAAGGSVTSDLAIQGLQRVAIGDQQALPGTPGTQDLLKQLGPGLRGADLVPDTSDAVAQYEEEAQRILEAQRGVIEGTNRTAEAFRVAGFDAATFYTTTREGQVALQETIAASVGSISGSFADLFQGLASSAQEGGQGLFVAYKAFATAQAIINTYQAASKALAEGGPFLGPILAAAAIVQGGVLVAKIAATNPGSKSVSGAGGGSKRAPTVTALGFNQDASIPGRASLSRPTGAATGASRNRVEVAVQAEGSFTPSGDFIGGIRAGLATEKKKGGRGTF